ncbi:glutathione S-transferase N-terminal domain-containing protein [bacterium]|nr:glutathione S-transferase N-terminal domain-containing protein [bacterium]
MLNLYVLKTCPYCAKVVEYLKEQSIDSKIKDIEEHENFDELMKLGGKEQVPFLYDDKEDTAMYDSERIIEYLADNYS